MLLAALLVGVEAPVGLYIPQMPGPSSMRTCFLLLVSDDDDSLLLLQLQRWIRTRNASEEEEEIQRMLFRGIAANRTA